MNFTVNLLHYPALDRQRRWRHRWTTSLAGGVVGVALAVSGVQWADSHARQIQQEQQRLQATLSAQKKQLQALQKQQIQQGAWQQQVQHLQAVAQQHKAWEVLHQALQREAREDALQLLSLQLTQGRLALHGRTSSLHSMNQARQRVSHEVGIDLKLFSALVTSEPPDQSKRQAPAMVEFVWQGDWPAPRSRSEKIAAEPSSPLSAKPLP